MPFYADRRLEDLLNPGAAKVASRAIADKGADRLMEAVKTRTPIDTSYSPLPQSRPRGTARESVVRGPVKQRSSPIGPRYEGRVYTEDPVFPYIEWNTRPHIIRPTPEHIAQAAAEGRRAMLRYFSGGGIRYARQVLHPGTTGQHPFARAEAFIEAEVSHMFDEELEQFARDLVSSRTGRVIDRTGRAPVDQIMSAAVASWIRSHTIQIPRAGRRAVADMLGG
jgi:hypothetical protein